MSAPSKLLVPLAALAMSVGWGFRGDYGHEAGAMVPGALLGLSVALASGRTDWAARASLLAFLGAIGWSFGGSMSYGRVVGYTAASSVPDVAYGFASLFVIGALWGGIGAGILALGVTRPRSELERFAGPIVAVYVVWRAMDRSGATGWLIHRWSLNDTDWDAATSALLVAAVYGFLVPRCRPACRLIATLAVGWWLGFGLLTLGLGLRMTPPRGDNWAGCVGLFTALIIDLARTRNRAAVWLAIVGALAGGVGFAFGDFIQMIGRANWGPIGRYESLQGLDYWKWMEQMFGLVMGAGVGAGFARAARDLPPPADDEPDGPLRWVTPVFLLVVMMWENLFKNVRTWLRGGQLRDSLLGVAPEWWCLVIGLLASACVIVAILRYRRSGLAVVPATAFGRGQLLFLVILWVAVIGAFLQAVPGLHSKGTLFVHVKFWVTAAATTMLVTMLDGPMIVGPASVIPPDDDRWWPGWQLVIMWVGLPLFVGLLTVLTISTHTAPLPGAQLRFPNER